MVDSKEDKNKFTNFQASLALKAALKENKINLENDPAYPALKEAEEGIMQASRICQVLAAIIPTCALYKFRYRQNFPITEIIMKILTIYGVIGAGYYINPSMTKYHELIAQISLRRKDELQAYVESHKNSK
ncbi:unnamed protein product [Blepharisma stoltei]|uniref:Uncharacterized protein n=1 Tax=Blepharisma stoltei TaxID=1481888 RepID=A0AAU9IGH0_9CILI|nr:unnamed protein product [Blepharisma stoltei]